MNEVRATYLMPEVPWALKPNGRGDCPRDVATIAATLSIDDARELVERLLGYVVKADIYNDVPTSSTFGAMSDAELMMLDRARAILDREAAREILGAIVDDDDDQLP